METKKCIARVRENKITKQKTVTISKEFINIKKGKKMENNKKDFVKRLEIKFLISLIFISGSSPCIFNIHLYIIRNIIKWELVYFR